MTEFTDNLKTFASDMRSDLQKERDRLKQKYWTSHSAIAEIGFKGSYEQGIALASLAQLALTMRKLDEALVELGRV